MYREIVTISWTAVSFKLNLGQPFLPAPTILVLIQPNYLFATRTKILDSQFQSLLAWPANAVLTATAAVLRHAPVIRIVPASLAV